MRLENQVALEWARFNIVVNCIESVAVKTRMTATIPENIAANLIEHIPLKRFLLCANHRH